jgi:hypothetical protein
MPRPSDVWTARSAAGSGRNIKETLACDAHRESRTSGARACGSAGGCSRRDEGAPFGLIVEQCLLVKALSGAIEVDGVMVAFAGVDADEHIDRAMLLVLLHGRFCRLNSLARNINGKSRYPRYGWPQDILAKPLLEITSHPPGPVTGLRRGMEVGSHENDMLKVSYPPAIDC